MFKKVNHNRIILTLILVLSSSLLKANNTAITSGAWETGTNWSLGAPPLTTDIVTIPSGITMTVNVPGDVCGSLTIAPTGSLIINAAGGLSIGGNFSNAG